MSVHYERDRRRYIVRWREDGRLRARRFATEADAEAFDARVNPGGRAAREMTAAGRRVVVADRVARLEAERAGKDSRDGVYPYATGHGVRWRIVFRRRAAEVWGPPMCGG